LTLQGPHPTLAAYLDRITPASGYWVNTPKFIVSQLKAWWGDAAMPANDQIIAMANSQLVRPEAFYWRTQAGAEVDLLIVAGRHITPIEIKAGSVVDARALAGLRQCMSDLSLPRGVVISGGDERRSIGGAIDLVPWQAVVEGHDVLDLGA
jgi:predicted AAA+ superfamily ATPase